MIREAISTLAAYFKSEPQFADGERVTKTETVHIFDELPRMAEIITYTVTGTVDNTVDCYFGAQPIRIDGAKETTCQSGFRSITAR